MCMRTSIYTNMCFPMGSRIEVRSEWPDYLHARDAILIISTAGNTAPHARR